MTASIPVRVLNEPKQDAAQHKDLTTLLSFIGIRLGDLLRESEERPDGSSSQPIVVAFDDTNIVSAIREVARALNSLTQPQEQLFSFIGGGFVRQFAGDRADENVFFQKPIVVDSEGTPLSPQPDLSYTFSSDDPTGLELTDNGDGTVRFRYGTPKQLEDGSFKIFEGRAESNQIDIGNGNFIKDVRTEQVQLLPGVAAGFTGGGFQFPPDPTPVVVDQPVAVALPVGNGEASATTGETVNAGSGV